MKRKVKKFGSGGDVLTGLGAGLIGYHLYNKYMGDDKDKKGGLKYDAKDIEGPTLSKPEPKEEKRREISDYMMNKPEEKKGGETRPGPDTSEPNLEKAEPKAGKPASLLDKGVKAPKKAAPAAQPKKAEPAATTQAAPKSPFSFDTDKPTKLTEPVDKDKPKGTKDLGKILGVSSDAKGTQSLGERIKGTVESAGKSVARTPAERMSEGARQVEKRRQEEKAKKEREKSGMRSGGAVKKYASGGSVSSASKRADGIAQRGKTRGRVC
jgi:hypothetical protein